MSKISKTAKASMPSGPAKEKSVIPDAELIRLLRIDREAGIYPGTQGTDALLREYDWLGGKHAHLSELLAVAQDEVKRLDQLNQDLQKIIDLHEGRAAESRGHVAVEELETLPAQEVVEAASGNTQS